MKKLIAMVLTLALCLSLWIPAGAEEPEAPALPTDQEIMDYALYFMTESQEDPGIVIRDFAHLTDGAGNPTGYYVSFNNQEGPAGYVLLSLLSDKDPVVEGAFGGEGLFDTEETASLFAETQLAAVDDKDSQQAQIIYRGPEQIYLPVEGNTYYSVYTREEVELETEITSYKSVMDGIYDWSAAKIVNSSVFKIKNFGSGTDYKAMDYFDLSNKNCSPTAGTNIMWYWGKQRGSIQVMSRVSYQVSDDDKIGHIYDILYAGMKTTYNGGTLPSNFIPGYTSFLGPAGTGVWNYKSLPNSPSFETFQSELNGHCPIHLSLGVFADSTSSNMKRHSVMAFGYGDSSTGAHYIFVMDGYNYHGRFVKYIDYPLIEGIKIWVA